MRTLLILALATVAGCNTGSLHSKEIAHAHGGTPRRGILVMAHGGDAEWNEAVEATIAPLREHQPVAIAFGMARPSTMDAAVRSLEGQGVEEIAVVRMFISGDSFLERTEQILGLRELPEPHEPHAMPAASGGGHHMESLTGPNDLARGRVVAGPWGSQ